MHSKLKLNGLTLLEIVISISIIATALIGMFAIFNVGMFSLYKANTEITATNLARSLMAEIMAKEFVDPQENNSALGRNPTSSPDENRFGPVYFDDMDDYANLTERPPKTIGNVTMDGTNNTPDCRNFTWNVTVACVNATMAQITCPAAPEYKRVTVTVDSPQIPDVVLTEVKAR